MRVSGRSAQGGLMEKVASELRLKGGEHAAVWTTALEGGRKAHKNTGLEANCALHGEETRQKPWSPMGLTHLDRELSGQNCPDCVTQAG